MNAGWAVLLLSGLLEIAWAHSIRLTEGFTRFFPIIGCAVLTVAVLLGLSYAMRSLPVGTAYAVFVGIGAIGTVVAGVVWLGEPVTIARAAALALILGGVVVLRLTEGAAQA
ncbi:DMT family transporter [Solicola gregarius]|uniref:SMR family transporter n=1 Tax=Solicola gregarius TaxID=2908642 RepID=A0AA46YMZ8_9ACTN|nr:SMR family transporter [Solicola gregarius]UYM07109.1 SMR family transporter [Solicola gregarius]